MASLLDLAQARLQGLLDIPTRAARALVNPTAFSGLLGAPTLPQQQGMAEAAYGLPARQNMSVLDPKQAAYLQGYQQGEPLAYLGMATPFAAPAAVAGAKAVAPKAGMALENYMASQGLIQPLTAFHGTPHTIRGKFDISKVGTGEGAQAYGHGMYFAENPAVAKQYATDRSYVGKVMAGTPDNTPWDAQRIAQDTLNVHGDNAVEQLQKTLKANSYSKNPQQTQANKQLEDAIDILKTNQLQPTGNLYKVDIPDEYIPMMMDLDKPLSQQPKVMGALRSEAEQRVKDRTIINIENDIRSSLPPIEIGNDYMAMFSDANVKASQEIKKQALEKLNKMDLSSLVNKELESMKPLAMNWNMTGKEYYEFLSKNQGSPAKASEMLQKQGITGNRYLDEVSRNRGQGTSNFVVFDPTDVKILEKNSQKVEGLLD